MHTKHQDLRNSRFEICRHIVAYRTR